MRNRLTRMRVGREKRGGGGWKVRGGEDGRRLHRTSEARAVQKLLNLIRLCRIAVQKRGWAGGDGGTMGIERGYTKGR